MKNFIFLIAFLPFFSLANKLVPVEDVFAPIGFSNEQNAEVIVTGYFPDTCYKKLNHELKIENKKIIITVNAVYDDSSVCSEMITPFTEAIPLGKLEAQNYKVTIISASPFNLKTKLIIQEASRDNEELTYPYVTTIRPTVDKRKILVEAYTVSSCFELEKIKIRSNWKNAYIVYPIMKQTSEFCPRKMTPITFVVKLPIFHSQNKYFVYVKSMYGSSSNAIYVSRITYL